MSAGRAVFLVLLLALCAFVGWLAFGVDDPTPTPPDTNGIPNEGQNLDPSSTDPAISTGVPGTFSHPSQCRDCHPAVYGEWEASMHAKAWTDPAVRDLSDDFEDTSCLPCHVPQPIHSSVVGSRVFARATRHESGVDCLSCHLMPDGRVAALHDIPDAPCRPVKVETMPEPESCAGCHDQHELVREWRHLFHEPDPEKGAVLTQGRPETCNDCHMAAVERTFADGRPARSGRSHVFPGGHHLDTLRRGVTIAAEVKNGRVETTTTNVGAGHKAPADSRHRSFNVWVSVETDGGVRLHDRREVAEYRMYYRSPPRESTNLRPGEARTAGLDLPRGTSGKVLVELVYALSPPRKESKDVIVVDTVELEFDNR